jgi:predicted RNA-binding Zn-ribbon protein involved in translation (DUF1610 family)
MTPLETETQKQRFVVAVEALALAKKALADTGNRRGQFPCPACGKTFFWATTATGRLRGTCSDGTCISFTESSQ